MIERRPNFQNISWFWDNYQRSRLNLDPPYQRKSVWNQEYKDYFIDTLLLCYPSPAIFLFEEMSSEGRPTYNVVDGKQRLTTVFEFINGSFPVSEAAQTSILRGQYFEELGDDVKRRFWSYDFLVEYLPTADEAIINNIFDRINKNVAKLTRQELRHARFDGEFVSAAEELSEWMWSCLPNGFPNIASQSRKQMKDIELVAQLLLFLEAGVRTYTQDDLDEAFGERDGEWDQRREIESRFKSTSNLLNDIATDANHGDELCKSRLRNQADFYSLFWALEMVRLWWTLRVLNSIT